MSCLSKSLWSAYLKGDFTDLTIVCGGKEYKVHKVVVCSQSKVFAAMARPPITESNSDRIILKDEDVQVFESALEYMYCGEYEYLSGADDDSEISDLTAPTPLSHHALVYAFADKYNVITLPKRAAENYKHELPYYKVWHDKVDGFCGYEDLPQEIWTDFFASVQLVYSTTPDDDRYLRDIVILGLRRYCTWLKTSASKNIQDDFAKWLKEETRMGMDLMDDMMRRPFVICTRCFKVADLE